MTRFIASLSRIDAYEPVGTLARFGQSHEHENPFPIRSPRLILSKAVARKGDAGKHPPTNQGYRLADSRIFAEDFKQVDLPGSSALRFGVSDKGNI